MFEWCMVRCKPKNKHHENHVLKKNWTTHSNFSNYFAHNSQHNWKDLLLKGVIILVITE